MGMQTLRTQRLRLEPIMIKHSDQLFELFQEPDLYRWITREVPTSVDNFRDDIRLLVGRQSKDRTEIWLNWVSVDTTTGQLVGKIEIALYGSSMEAHLAYTTFKPHWRRGYAKEGCAVVISHLFSAWSILKVVIEMDVQNQASVRLAESLGAQRTGFKPKAKFFKGVWSDEYSYAIERQE